MKQHEFVVWVAFPLLLVTTVAPSFAGSIPSAPLVPPVAGESHLTSFIIGPLSKINVDWWVIPTTGTPFPDDAFAYLYQIENTTTSGVDAFSITLSPGAASSLLAYGVLPGDDLDVASAYHPAHLVGGEEESLPFVPLSSVSTTINLSDDTISWTFNPMGFGEQSDTLFFVSTDPPIYGNGVAQNSIPPSPWGTLAPGADPLPIPAPPDSIVVPEPSSALLALLAIAFGWRSVNLRRSRRRKSGQPV